MNDVREGKERKTSTAPCGIVKLVTPHEVGIQLKLMDLALVGRGTFVTAAGNCSETVESFEKSLNAFTFVSAELLKSSFCKVGIRGASDAKFGRPTPSSVNEVNCVQFVKFNNSTTVCSTDSVSNCVMFDMSRYEVMSNRKTTRCFKGRSENTREANSGGTRKFGWFEKSPTVLRRYKAENAIAKIWRVSI